MSTGIGLDAEAPGRQGAGGRGFTPLRVLGVVVMLAIALFWLWIFSGAPRRQNPDYLSDRSWVEQAEATCAATMDTIDERASSAGREDRAVRADAIDAGTADLRSMLDELGSPPPDDADDREVVGTWLADWRRLLDDRVIYARAIRVNPDARFLTTERFNDPLDRVIEVFADVNEMPSCGPAGDVG